MRKFPIRIVCFLMSIILLFQASNVYASQLAGDNIKNEIDGEISPCAVAQCGNYASHNMKYFARGENIDSMFAY